MHAIKERDVINNYFEEGLAVAIRDALKSLFAEPRLPDNPFYYLASAVGAYLDQHELWKLPDTALVSMLDDEGGLEVADAASKLCKLSACSNVWGLPHVLRCVSKEGVKVLQDVLANSMPDSFFPGPMPFSSKNGYTTQVLASVQGSSALWRPSWLEFPELVVRCDVVVRGPRLDEALGQLAALLLQDLTELDAVPLYFTNGLRVVEPLGAAAAAALAGSSRQRAAAPGSNPGPGPAVGAAFWGLAEMLACPDDFKRVLSRSVLAGKCLELAAVVLVDAPTDAQHQERSLRFEVAVKRYCFHFWSTPESTTASAAAAPGPDASTKAKGKAKPSAGNSSTSYTSHKLQAEVSHYGSSPFEALFEGFFLDPAAAKQYLQLFLQDHEQPYAPAPLAANVDQLACLIDSHMLDGATLQGLQRLLLLVMLQDPLPRSPGPLAPASLLSLEDLLLARAQTNQVDMLLSTLPNLLRMTNTGAAVIQGVVREIEAVQLVAELWPARREACRAAAARGTEPARNDAATPSGAGAACAPASSTLEWLDRFNMSAQVLQQLVSLRPRIAEATGSGIFSGISLITNQLLAELPAAVPAAASQCNAALAGAQDGLAALQQLLEAAALTLADALLDRCRDVTWALARFGIHLVDSVMARAALTADEGSAQPEWALHVAAVTEAQVRAGAVAERVATEGVMLQYAVDTQLDLLLSTVHASITQPPMPLNPYPRLLHLLRAQAARLDLWKDDTDTVCEQLLNQLVLLDPRGFMYAASPPAAGRGGRARRRGRLAAAAGPAGLEDDGTDATVFGSYAAVTLCDCRALQTLAASLGALLSERHWQQGAYSADVLLALVGDAWLSGALGLGEDSAAAAAGPQAAGALPGQAAQVRCLFEHPRFYAVEAEEHHQVSGPRVTQAAAVFAAGVVDYVLHLHHHSPHIVVQLVVHLGSGPQAHSLQQLLTQQGRQCLVSSLVEAVRAAAAARPVTFPDARLATLTLLVALQGLYVPLLKHLHFNHRSDGLPLQTTSTAAAVHRPGGAAQPAFLMPSSGDPGSMTPALYATGAAAPDDDDGSEPHWCLGVYQRVFLAESSAAAWQAWNALRGDPAQPFHHQHIVQQAAQQVKQLEAAGGLLDAQKLLLSAGAAMQDIPLLLHVSRAMQSAAQELRCLQVMSALLQFLLSIDDSLQRGKLDSERVRRLFLLYCTRLRAALASPRYCYFSGFASAAARLINELKEQVLGSLQLGGGAAGLMRQLDLWTRCCELSVAASIHDCFEPGVTRLSTNGGGC